MVEMQQAREMTCAAEIEWGRWWVASRSTTDSVMFSRGAKTAGAGGQVAMFWLPWSGEPA